MKKIVSGLVGTLVAVMTMYFLIGQKDMKENIVDAKEVAFEIKAINETVNRNEIVEIKLQVNSSIPMGKVEAYINYDSEILEFVDASSEQINGTAGTLYLVDEFLAGNTQAEYTIRMKALAIGTSKITISDCYIEDESFVTINEVEKTEGIKIEYLYGTMIEIPRAAITADQMAKTAQFFSFGTNDLTQMTFGFSRDDIGGFMKDYLDNKILPGDPFQTIDRESVGVLIETGVTKGRSTNEKLKIGICGEHGGDPDSVEFCHLAGMNYVSCSPFRVPIARLAAAQAAIKHNAQK